MAQRALITGGTGFLGARVALSLKSRYSVVLADRIDDRTQSVQALTGCKAIALDVTKIDSVREVFAEVRPTIVIHAAANKFVDIAEKELLESVDVNVLGSENVARVAMETQVGTVVAISSNAATPPQTSVYGLAKAIVERMFCSLNGKTTTKLTSIRLGNIAWSTGSVLPVWRRMLTESGEIGTTGPDKRRFFCSVDEAVGLVTTSIDRIDDLAGRVLVPKLKQALIKDVLTQFVELNGGIWKRAEDRAGERADEALIGDLEVPYTREVMFDGVAHYVISFNEKAANPIGHAITASSAEPLSADEIVGIITNAPVDAH